MKTCDTCVWWKSYAYGKDRIPVRGECRLNPPIVIHDDEDIEDPFPITHASAWCSHHKTRTD